MVDPKNLTLDFIFKEAFLNYQKKAYAEKSIVLAVENFQTTKIKHQVFKLF